MGCLRSSSFNPAAVQDQSVNDKFSEKSIQLSEATEIVWQTKTSIHHTIAIIAP